MAAVVAEAVVVMAAVEAAEHQVAAVERQAVVAGVRAAVRRAEVVVGRREQVGRQEAPWEEDPE